jgi:hypothetical protein
VEIAVVSSANLTIVYQTSEKIVFTAILRQPASTPAVAGMMPPAVGITEPAVDPFPEWRSGIAATRLAGVADSEVSMSCRIASG